jgi:hypothetical protein
MTTLMFVHRFISSLAFTCTVETITLWLLVRYALKDTHTPWQKILFAGMFASFATITYVWFVFPVMATWPKGLSTVWSEPFVFLVEALFYKLFLDMKWKNALAASFICNVASFVAGPILRSLGLWFYW